MNSTVPSSSGSVAGRVVVRRGTLAIVGRPNVGKSSLFNRLVGRRQSIVHDLPGVTRDRVFGTFELDDERTVDLIDTGGLVPGDDPIGLNAQVLMAVDEADALLLVVDGSTGLTGGDEAVVSALRRSGKPIQLVVNKSDVGGSEQRLAEFWSLGVGEPLLLSAEHGRGFSELHEILVELIPVVEVENDLVGDCDAIAIVGRPNVGKSSLLNRLVGDDRSLVSPVAGTTRDPVDTRVRWNDRDLVLVDTAGIRRRSQVTGQAEGLAVMMARRQIERADLAILVVDAAAGITSGDLAIAGTIWELGRCCVVVCNKWDLLEGEEARENLEKGWERLEEILAKPARINTSAVTARGLEKIYDPLIETLDHFRLEIGTSKLNEILHAAVERHHVPTKGGKAWKIYYASQVGTGPPTFMLFANRVLPRSSSLRRYLENTLRRELDLPGVPIRLVIRKRT